jgi:hypothetical protein
MIWIANCIQSYSTSKLVNWVVIKSFSFYFHLGFFSVGVPGGGLGLELSFFFEK